VYVYIYMYIYTCVNIHKCCAAWNTHRFLCSLSNREARKRPAEPNGTHAIDLGHMIHFLVGQYAPDLCFVCLFCLFVFLLLLRV